MCVRACWGEVHSAHGAGRPLFPALLQTTSKIANYVVHIQGLLTNIQYQLLQLHKVFLYFLVSDISCIYFCDMEGTQTQNAKEGADMSVTSADNTATKEFTSSDLMQVFLEFKRT